MYITRRKFLKNACLAGKAELFLMAGGNVFFSGCSPEDETRAGKREKALDKAQKEGLKKK